MEPNYEDPYSILYELPKLVFLIWQNNKTLMVERIWHEKRVEGPSGDTNYCWEIFVFENF